MQLSKVGSAGLALVLLSSVSLAQETVPQPAESAKKRSEETVGVNSTPASWQAASVSGRLLREEELREEEPIGAYAQPRWTAQRRFPTTRIYVRPAGTFQFEWWQESKLSLKDLDNVRHRSQFEFEIGLGHRLQLDLYLTTEQNGHQGPYQLKSEKFEVRYALADWNVIPTNPTLYAEFVREHEGPPKIELKLLLGGEMARGWHWGSNLVFERQLGGANEQEYVFTLAASRTIKDSEFSLGAELKVEAVDVSGNRFDWVSYEFLAGPSIQWHPVPPMHVDLVALFGVEVEGDEKTPLAEPLLVVGWEF